MSAIGPNNINAIISQLSPPRTTEAADVRRSQGSTLTQQRQARDEQPAESVEDPAESAPEAVHDEFRRSPDQNRKRKKNQQAAEDESNPALLDTFNPTPALPPKPKTSGPVAPDVLSEVPSHLDISA